MPTGRKTLEKKLAPAAVEEAGSSFRTDFGQRLKAVADLFDSRISASEAAGVVPEQLQKYIRGLVKPPFEVVRRLAHAKGVSLDWLAEGHGPMMAERPEVPDEWVLVPVYKVEAASGYGAYPAADEEEHEPLAFPRLQLRRLASHGADKLVIVFNRGDSNVPDIGDGDAMLVDRAVERIRDDAFYVVGNDDRLMVKLVEQLFDGRVALKSRNAQYREEILSRADAERLNVFGRVVWRGGVV